LVTGASRGIGRACALSLADAGARVAVAARSVEQLESLAAEIRSQGREAFVVPVDLADAGSIQEAIAKTAKDFGPIAILVNNAGITKDTAFHKMAPEQWSAVINTNLNSLFNMCRPVIEGMRDRKFGRIINISSINGQKGQFGQTNYSAAKAGEIGFTKALAQENAKLGISVNAICPGYINTEMVQAVPVAVLEKAILPYIPVGRLGEPEEIARCVVFLASDDSGFITGSTLSANGGQVMV
jgi:acetoacetyl-CoA reductase